MSRQLPINIEVPPHFLEEEVRDDFLITEKTKKVWAVELDLLNELLRVCKKHNIEVYAFAGTLLGAVRHKGFIPWDDDLDVCLTRDNFEKLLHVAKEEFKEPYFLQTGYNDKKFFLGYARLRNSQTTGIITWNKSAEYNNGIYVDVYVLDGLCENEKKKRFQHTVIKLITRFADAYNTSSKKIHALAVKNVLCKLVKYEYVLDLYHKVLKKYNNGAKRVSILTHTQLSIVERYSISREDLQGSQCLPYEFIALPVPKNYESILENTYGDYMKFPPVEQRGEWHKGILIQDPDKSYIDFLKEEQDGNQETD